MVAKLCLFFLPLPVFAGLSVMMSSLTAVVISCGCALLAAFLLRATLRSIDWTTVSFLLVTLLASHFSNVGFIDPDFAIIAILIFFILALRPIYQREWMAD